MKYKCDLIRDLLPLCQDGIASEASKTAVREHLKECAECRRFQQNMGMDDLSQPVSLIDQETNGYTQVAKRIRKRKALLTACLVLFLVSATYFSHAYATGKSFRSYDAAQNSRWIDEASILLKQVDVSPFHVYLYENEDKYRTIVTTYSFPFWSIASSSWANKTEDQIKLVGWYSESRNGKGITVVPVQSFDEEITYIEMGSSERLRKEIITGEVTVFSWNRALKWNELNGVAYSADGTPLYKLGYDTQTGMIKIDELRWLPVAQ